MGRSFLSLGIEREFLEDSFACEDFELFGLCVKLVQVEVWGEPSLHGA